MPLDYISADAPSEPEFGDPQSKILNLDCGYDFSESRRFDKD